MSPPDAERSGPDRDPDRHQKSAAHQSHRRADDTPAVERLSEAIAVDVNRQVEAMVARGWRRDTAVAAVRRWWLRAAEDAIDDGARRIRLVDRVDAGCSCHAGLELDLPALAKRINEEIVYVRHNDNQNGANVLDLHGAPIGPAIWCPWLLFVCVECNGDVALATVVTGEKWQAS